MEIAAHLGGYVVGGDPATWYPALWEWLVTTQNVSSVLDIGCGEGQAIDYFRSLGCLTVGVDGVPQDDWRIVTHDFTTGPRRPSMQIEFDLVWCCEFVEHVEERYVPNFLESFRLAPLVLMTHADPGQLGHHHVNCQTGAYWIGAMAAIGYKLDLDLTSQARARAAMNSNPYNHFVRSGLAFRRA